MVMRWATASRSTASDQAAATKSHPSTSHVSRSATARIVAMDSFQSRMAGPMARARTSKSTSAFSPIASVWVATSAQKAATGAVSDLSSFDHPSTASRNSANSRRRRRRRPGEGAWTSPIGLMTLAISATRW